MIIPFKNSFLSWMIKKRIHQIELFLKYPFAVQDELLLNLIGRAKNTEFGKAHGFNSIKSYEEFKNSVEVKTYEEFYPYIKKLREEGENILWPGKIKWFAKSSGTTNAKSKYIPITEEALEECHFKAGKDMLSIYCNNNLETTFFDGMGLILGGSQSQNPLKKYTDGDLSAILIDNLPFWVNMHRTPDLTTALMPKWEEKLEKIIALSVKEDVSNLTGVPSWMLILLNKILEKTGADNIMEVWPNLELYMHGGMNFSPYKEQFQKIIPNPKMNYIECYTASEGYFAIQDQTHSDEMLLMLDNGIFYEFIAMEDFKNSSRKAIGLNEVELYKTYAIVISTNAGLWRYLIGDTIAFTSLKPFRIKIIGRTKSFINAFGEELVVENAENALKHACRKTQTTIKEFTVAPLYINQKTSGAHQWLIEFEKQPKDLDIFTKEIDNFLQTINSDYQTKRTNDLILKMPKIEMLKSGTFYKWLGDKGKLGGQNKVPRLSNNREIVEEILKMN